MRIKKGAVYAALCCIAALGAAVYLVQTPGAGSIIRSVARAGAAVLIGSALGTAVFMLCSGRDGSNPESAADREGAVVLTAPSVQYYYNGYSCGFCRVEKITVTEQGGLSSEFNFIDESGRYISSKWYAAASDFGEDGVALVSDGKMYNVINKDGELISVNWYYGIEPFSDGKAKVRWNDGTVNFLTAGGKLLWKDWKPEIDLSGAAVQNDPQNN